MPSGSDQRSVVFRDLSHTRKLAILSKLALRPEITGTVPHCSRESLVASISQKNPVRLFVGHVFEDDENYLRVFEYLESSHNFFYLNCSNTEHRLPTELAQKEELRRQIALAETVIITAGSYAEHRELINFELNCAKGLGKPVIIMELFGVKEKLPVQLEALADEVVEWDERSLCDAVRRTARHEDTTRWDTIEFKLD